MESSYKREQLNDIDKHISEIIDRIALMNLSVSSFKVGMLKINLNGHSKYIQIVKEIVSKFNLKSKISLFTINLFCINSSNTYQDLNGLFDKFKTFSIREELAGIEVKEFDAVKTKKYFFGWLKLPPTLGYSNKYKVYAIVNKTNILIFIDKDPDFFVTYVNTLFLALFSIFSKIYWIHASAVEFKSNGVLIVGPSGSGKTTTCVHLLAKGGTILGDGVSFLESGKIINHFYSVPPHLSLGEQTLDIYSSDLERISEQIIDVRNEKTIVKVRDEIIAIKKTKVNLIILPQFSLVEKFSIKEVSLYEFIKHHHEDLFKPELFHLAKLFKIGWYLKLRYYIYWIRIFRRVKILKVIINKDCSNEDYNRLITETL
jgi:hypothetical protein